MDKRDWLPTRLEGAKSRFLEYVDASGADDPTNEVAVVVYDEEARLACPFTHCSQRSEFERRLAHVRSGSYTNITAALELADKLLAPCQGTPSELLVHLLTDGHHNCRGTPAFAAAALKQRGVIIDVVGIGGSSNDVDEALLREIASDHPEGGKRYQFIGDAKRLSEHYRNLGGRLSE